MNTAIRNDMPDSVMARKSAALDPEKFRWSTLETLIALLIDEVRNNTWVYMQTHSKARIPPPVPIRRPGISRLPERATKTLRLADAQRMDPRLRGLTREEAQAKLDELTSGRKQLQRGGD